MAFPVQYRRANPDDHDRLGQMVYDAVHQDNPAYSPRQRRAWMPAPPGGSAWALRLSRQTVCLAEVNTGPVGVMTLTQHGDIDLAYIAAPWRGQGLFRTLYTHIAAAARQAGTDRLHVHASRMAEPAFRAMGFILVKPDSVERHGETLHRVLMTTSLKTGRDDHG